MSETTLLVIILILLLVELAFKVYDRLEIRTYPVPTMIPIEVPQVVIVDTEVKQFDPFEEAHDRANSRIDSLLKEGWYA